MTIIVLSGEIAAGKSTLAKMLGARWGVEPAHTRTIITRHYRRAYKDSLEENPPTREALQAHGELLDRETNGKWLSESISLTWPATIIDAARRQEHVDALRERYDRVLHVHLEANAEALRDRFVARGEPGEYERFKANATEAQVPSLRKTADLVIDTSRTTQEDVLLRVLAAANPRRFTEPTVDVVIGGQYGSEGKGHIVSHIADEYSLLVRVGGPNAGHTVLHPQTGEKVSFYHLPSGSLHSPDAKLVLGPGAVINPQVLIKEAEHLGGLEALKDRLYIDPQANIITTSDIEREAKLVAGIGSTGQGVGLATAGKITDRSGGRSLARDLRDLEPFIKPTLEVLDSAYRNGIAIMLEGTQGTGLSLHHGHYPFVTSRDTTASGTAGEAGIPPSRIRKTIVVLRTNPIRVQSPAGGTSGPMGRELTWEEVSKRAGIPADELRAKEMTTTTKRQRRVAEFNWQDLHRAVMLNGPTDLALTFVDYIAHSNQDARRYEQLSEETLRFIEEIERVAGTPVSLITTRFHKRSIIDRRSW